MVDIGENLKISKSKRIEEGQTIDCIELAFIGNGKYAAISWEDGILDPARIATKIKICMEAFLKENEKK